MVKEYSDNHFEITLNNGIVHVKWLAEYINQTEVFDTAIRKRLEIQNYQTFPLFSDIRKLKGGNKEIKSRLTQKDALSNVSAVSVLCSSKYHISQFNWFNLKGETNIPSRLFIEEEEAIAWLKRYQQNGSGTLNQKPFDDPEIKFANENHTIEFRDGIVFVKWLKEKYDENDVDVLLKTKLKIFNGRFFPVFTDFSLVKSGSRSAYRRLSEPDSFIGVKASATLCKTNVQSVLFKLFHKIFKPQFPSRIFSDEAKAIEWLSKYK